MKIRPLGSKLFEISSWIYVDPHVKYPLFLSVFNWTWIFLVRCSKNSQISNFMKIRPLGSKLFEISSWIYVCLHVKYPLFLSVFNGTWIFLVRCSKNSQISNFMKIRPLGSKLFQISSWIYVCLHVKYPLFLSVFNGTWIFLDRCSKNSQILIFMKSRSLGPNLFLTDG